MSFLLKKCREGSPLIMGIVNVTPDSFSDGGSYLSVDQAISRGLSLLDEGADILDIGGESTRPNANIVSVEDEIERVVPVVEGLARNTRIISIDTRNAKTMQAAIKAGANMVNDVSGLIHDVDSASVVADSGLPVCIMHMKGTPQVMQNSPVYDCVIDELLSFFHERLEFCALHNIGAERVILDPGIGFGKTVEHNLSILKNIGRFQNLGCPVMLGTSRKSFIGSICDEKDPKKRVYGSISSALYGFSKNVQIFRVHDVKETKQALKVYQAISFAT